MVVLVPCKYKFFLLSVKLGMLKSVEATVQFMDEILAAVGLSRIVYGKDVSGIAV